LASRRNAGLVSEHNEAIIDFKTEKYSRFEPSVVQGRFRLLGRQLGDNVIVTTAATSGQLGDNFIVTNAASFSVRLLHHGDRFRFRHPQKEQLVFKVASKEYVTAVRQTLRKRGYELCRLL